MFGAMHYTDSGVPVGQRYQRVTFTNGPVGHETYTDDTYHAGLNVGALSGGVGRIDTSLPNLAISFESQYFNGHVFGQEFHLQGVSADGLTTFRPWSFFAAHDASYIGAALKVDTFVIASTDDQSVAQFHVAQAAWDIGATGHPVQLRFVENGVPALQQLNAARTSYVNLIYLDDLDRATIAAPLDVVGARTTATFATFQPLAAQANDTAIKVDAPAISGHYSGFRASGSASGTMRTELENTATGASAHAQMRAVVSGASGGDPSVFLGISGAQDWSIGARNSDGDALVFAAASSLGSHVRLRIAPDGTVRVPGLAGIGTRYLCVEPDGTLVAGAAV